MFHTIGPIDVDIIVFDIGHILHLAVRLREFGIGRNCLHIAEGFCCQVEDQVFVIFKDSEVVVVNPFNQRKGFQSVFRIISFDGGIEHIEVDAAVYFIVFYFGNYQFRWCANFDIRKLATTWEPEQHRHGLGSQRFFGFFVHHQNCLIHVEVVGALRLQA